jgi:hypothetical protein
MDAVLLLLLIAFLVFGIPMLCRMAIRRMGASEGMREWLHAYGPRLPFLERGNPDDESDA